MALEDPLGHRVDRVAVGDVAELDLAADLVGEGPQPVFPARDEHAVPALLARAAAPIASPIPDDAPVTTAIRRPASRLVRCARRRHGRTP